jgi:starch-binding outer membrane protein, SusD/RagB family
MKKCLYISLLFSTIGCTDLIEKNYSELTPEQFLVNQQSVESLIVAAYDPLNKYIWNYWNISEGSSDEMQTNYHEQGSFIFLNSHNFYPGHDITTNLWNDCYEGVSNCDNSLEMLSVASDKIPNKAQVKAEIRTLRAFYYYLLLDTFGNVPIISRNENSPKQSSRKQVFEHCEKELKEALVDLPKVATLGRVTSGVAQAILNKLYLNAQIYTGTPRWEDCINTADAIIKSNVYQLELNYYDNFKLQNSSSKEAIFLIQFSREHDIGFPNMNFYMRSLHYNQAAASPWNGFCTIAEVYDSFDSTDVRRQALWIGPQYLPLTWPQSQTQGTLLKDRTGRPLIFTKFVSANSWIEYEGVRVIKYEPDLLAPGGQGENDYLIFRLSDIILAKSEALFRLNRKAEALVEINKVRSRVNLPSLTDLNLMAIYKERGNELYWEGLRRQDMIRFDTFWNAYSNKPESKRQKERTILFPIPLDAMAKNPNLVQNPNY